jgi:hypothetical protein
VAFHPFVLHGHAANRDVVHLANGIVDAADYTVWHDSLGESGSGLVADGDSVLDSDDYDVWKANYGNHSESGAGATAAVPEPATAMTLIVGILLLRSRRRANVP